MYVLFVVVCSVKERETVDRCDPRFSRSVASSAKRHINVPATQDRSLADASITARAMALAALLFNGVVSGKIVLSAAHNGAVRTLDLHSVDKWF